MSTLAGFRGWITQMKVALYANLFVDFLLLCYDGRSWDMDFAQEIATYRARILMIKSIHTTLPRAVWTPRTCIGFLA